ncbi:hypothetical protein [Blastococcus sp. CT_GayMR19]|uniref:hypothetical protein n=1 Tax=Blastococcus sp. CT_GayMR19 TaxID=2559608 RepID=UPI001431E85F|nr:hypothetical protein [Blastococcus sp. CT_GayMR19]
MTDHTAHGSDRSSSALGRTSAAGARLPARLRRRRALLVPPPPVRAARAAS